MAKIKPEEPCPCGSGKLFADCHAPKVIGYQRPVISQRIALKVIPEPDPDTRAVFVRIGDETILMESNVTNISMDCGKCGSPLIVGLDPRQVGNIVIQCNHCGSFNDSAQ